MRKLNVSQETAEKLVALPAEGQPAGSESCVFEELDNGSVIPLEQSNPFTGAVSEGQLLQWLETIQRHIPRLLAANLRYPVESERLLSLVGRALASSFLSVTQCACAILSDWTTLAIRAGATFAGASSRGPNLLRQPALPKSCRWGLQRVILLLWRWIGGDCPQPTLPRQFVGLFRDKNGTEAEKEGNEGRCAMSPLEQSVWEAAAVPPAQGLHALLCAFQQHPKARPDITRLLLWIGGALDAEQFHQVAFMRPLRDAVAGAQAEKDKVRREPWLKLADLLFRTYLDLVRHTAHIRWPLMLREERKEGAPAAADASVSHPNTAAPRAGAVDPPQSSGIRQKRDRVNDGGCGEHVASTTKEEEEEEEVTAWRQPYALPSERHQYHRFPSLPKGMLRVLVWDAPQETIRALPHASLEQCAEAMRHSIMYSLPQLLDICSIACGGGDAASFCVGGSNDVVVAVMEVILSLGFVSRSVKGAAGRGRVRWVCDKDAIMHALLLLGRRAAFSAQASDALIVLLERSLGGRKVRARSWSTRILDIIGKAVGNAAEASGTVPQQQRLEQQRAVNVAVPLKNDGLASSPRSRPLAHQVLVEGMLRVLDPQRSPQVAPTPFVSAWLPSLEAAMRSKTVSASVPPVPDDVAERWPLSATCLSLPDISLVQRLVRHPLLTQEHLFRLGWAAGIAIVRDATVCRSSARTWVAAVLEALRRENARSRWTKRPRGGIAPPGHSSSATKPSDPSMRPARSRSAPRQQNKPSAHTPTLRQQPGVSSWDVEGWTSLYRAPEARVVPSDRDMHCRRRAGSDAANGIRTTPGVTTTTQRDLGDDDDDWQRHLARPSTAQDPHFRRGSRRSPSTFLGELFRRHSPHSLAKILLESARGRLASGAMETSRAVGRSARSGPDARRHHRHEQQQHVNPLSATSTLATRWVRTAAPVLFLFTAERIESESTGLLSKGEPTRSHDDSSGTAVRPSQTHHEGTPASCKEQRHCQQQQDTFPWESVPFPRPRADRAWHSAKSHRRARFLRAGEGRLSVPTHEDDAHLTPRRESLASRSTARGERAAGTLSPSPVRAASLPEDATAAPFPWPVPLPLEVSGWRIAETYRNHESEAACRRIRQVVLDVLQAFLAVHDAKLTTAVRVGLLGGVQYFLQHDPAESAFRRLATIPADVTMLLDACGVPRQMLADRAAELALSAPDGPSGRKDHILKSPANGDAGGDPMVLHESRTGKLPSCVTGGAPIAIPRGDIPSSNSKDEDTEEEEEDDGTAEATPVRIAHGPHHNRDASDDEDDDPRPPARLPNDAECWHARSVLPHTRVDDAPLDRTPPRTRLPRPPPRDRDGPRPRCEKDEVDQMHPVGLLHQPAQSPMRVGPSRFARPFQRPGRRWRVRARMTHDAIPAVEQTSGR